MGSPHPPPCRCWAASETSQEYFTSAHGNPGSQAQALRPLCEEGGPWNRKGRHSAVWASGCPWHPDRMCPLPREGLEDAEGGDKAWGRVCWTSRAWTRSPVRCPAISIFSDPTAQIPYIWNILFLPSSENWPAQIKYLSFHEVLPFSKKKKVCSPSHKPSQFNILLLTLKSHSISPFHLQN